MDLIRGGFNKRRFLKCTRRFRSKQIGCNKRLDLLTVDLLTEFHCISFLLQIIPIIFGQKLHSRNQCLRRKREAREPHTRSKKAKKTIGLKAKLLNKQRHHEKIQMKKTLKVCASILFVVIPLLVFF